MKSILRLFVVAFAVLALAGAFGCGKVTVESVCQKLAEGDEVQECIEELGEELEECTNSDDVLKCMGDAADEDAAEACFSACQRAEEGEGE